MLKKFRPCLSVNSQAPGADLLHNSGTIEFNRALLVDPIGIPRNPFLLLAALEDPDLPMLSPLSKYLFYRNTINLTDSVLRDCLESTHVAINSIRDERPTHECVRFEIERVLGEHTFNLQFTSEAELIWAGDDDEQRGESIDTAISLLSLADRLAQLHPFSVEELAEFLFSEANALLAMHKRSDSPDGYITDDGAFVCSIEHKLVSINGFKLDPKPTLEDSVHESYITGAGACAKEIDRDEKFSWIEILDNDTRSKMDITDIDMANLGPGSRENEQLYLTAELLEWHYGRGRVESRSCNDLCIVSVLFGAGVDWDPDLTHRQRDFKELDEFPEECPPTHKLILSRSGTATDEEMNLMHVLSLLAETIRIRGLS